MNFSFRPLQSQQMWQKMMASPKMQQALHIMQAPVLEIAEILTHEAEQNPLLELEEEVVEWEGEEDVAPEELELNFSDEDFALINQVDEEYTNQMIGNETYSSFRSSEEEQLKSFLTESIPEEFSLFEKTLKKCHSLFSEPQELAIAEQICGNLSEDGFLEVPVEQIALLNQWSIPLIDRVLKTIQTLDPPGIGAKSLQESLLIQLERKGLKTSLAYQMILNHFDQVLNNQIPTIANALSASFKTIEETIKKDILILDLHPGRQLVRFNPEPIVPDAKVVENGEKFTVEIENEWIPTIRMNRKYLRLLKNPETPSETQDYLLQKLHGAKWLIRALDQRNDTLTKVIQGICEKQQRFLMNQGPLTPLTMQSIADQVGVHVSTVARAVSNKYIDTPRGLFPLRFFFSQALQSNTGDLVSSQSIQETLAQLIREEDKRRPLSDERLSKLLEAHGVQCARRTIAKYRKEMNIGNTQQRKRFCV